MFRSEGKDSLRSKLSVTQAKEKEKATAIVVFVIAKQVLKMENIKLVVVGDRCVGKTMFLIRVTTRSYPTKFIPTYFDNYSVTRVLNGSLYSVYFWDTRPDSGEGDEDRLRPLSYRGTDVFVVCFDVANRSSFLNVTEKWIPELRHYVPEVPVLLLATKTDLRVGK